MRSFPTAGLTPTRQISTSGLVLELGFEADPAAAVVGHQSQHRPVPKTWLRYALNRRWVAPFRVTWTLFCRNIPGPSNTFVHWARFCMGCLEQNDNPLVDCHIDLHSQYTIVVESCA